MKCKVCRMEFDPADLTQVFYHEEHKPVEVVVDNQGNPVRGVLVKKGYVPPTIVKNDPLTDIMF